VLAAVAWVGGSMFLVGVLGPTLRSSRLGPHAAMVIRDSGRRFRTITYATFAVFLLTGAALLAHRGFVFTPLLVTKLILVGAAFTASGFHDFGAGPAAARAAQDNDALAAARWRRLAAWLGRLNLVLTTTIVILSVVIVRLDQ
jgi:uncharacterized membrane protein